MAYNSFIVRIILENALDDLTILQPYARTEIDIDGAFKNQIRVRFGVDLDVIGIACSGFIAEIGSSISSDRT